MFQEFILLNKPDLILQRIDLQEQYKYEDILIRNRRAYLIFARNLIIHNPKLLDVFFRQYQQYVEKCDKVLKEIPKAQTEVVEAPAVERAPSPQQEEKREVQKEVQ